jgi:glutathione S-transferase
MMSAGHDTDKPVLYSMAVCPYAQRTEILLKIKNIDYDAVQIDISQPRPAYLLAVNPLGKVPVLIHRGKALNESSIINEYLDEVYPDTPLMPADPYQRALSRLLIDYCNTQFSTNHYRLLMEQRPDRRQGAEAAVLADWRWLDAFLMRINPDGDYAWDKFGMADLSYAPFFQRFVLNTYFWDFKLPEGELRRVRRWQEALREHPAVRATSLSDEDYIKLYADYALGYSNGKLPPGRERSSFDLGVALADRAMPEKRSLAMSRTGEKT